MKIMSPCTGELNYLAETGAVVRANEVVALIESDKAIVEVTVPEFVEEAVVLTRAAKPGQMVSRRTLLLTGQHDG